MPRFCDVLYNSYSLCSSAWFVKTAAPIPTERPTGKDKDTWACDLNRSPDEQRWQLARHEHLPLPPLYGLEPRIPLPSTQRMIVQPPLVVNIPELPDMKRMFEGEMDLEAPMPTVEATDEALGYPGWIVSYSATNYGLDPDTYWAAKSRKSDLFGVECAGALHIREINAPLLCVLGQVTHDADSDSQLYYVPRRPAIDDQGYF